jgi:hypothetical protein
VTFVRRNLYTANSAVRRRQQIAPWGKSLAASRQRSPTRSCPEALGSSTGYSVRSSRRLLWPHPSHSPSSRGLLFSSAGNGDREWVPNLSSAFVRACHPQNPGGPNGCDRLLLPRSHWSSSNLHGLDIRNPRTLVPAWRRNEADSGSLALRPARLLALHQQGRLLPSFRRPGRPATASVMTT